MQNPGAAAGAAGADGNQIAPHIEPMFADNQAWGCYTAQQFKEVFMNVFVNENDKCFLKNNKRTADFFAEMHMQYVFIWMTKAGPSGLPLVRYNEGLLNPEENPPFKCFKQYVAIPLLARRYHGVFPPDTVKGKTSHQEAARFWLADI